MKKIIFLTSLFLTSLFIILPLTKAGLFDELSSNPTIDNLIIKIHGPTVLRSGNNIIIRPVVINNNSDESVTIKQIRFLNSNKEIIKNSNINKMVNPIREKIKEAKELMSEQDNILETNQRYQELVSSIQEGIFSESSIFDIHNFDSSPKIGDVVTIPIGIEIEYDGKTFTIKKEHSILISEPLPNPPHNSPGWYKGDQHVHDNWSENPIEPDIPPISDMVSAAQQVGLEWVIFTDHSDSFYMDANIFSIANQQCNNEDENNQFECIYGQELAIDESDGLCDRRHYLAYDANPSYIDGTCSGIAYCNCWDAESKINELTDNGGYGFIAHPHTTENFLWITPDWEDWSLTGFTGLEILNGHLVEYENNDNLRAIRNMGEDINSWEEFLLQIIIMGMM